MRFLLVETERDPLFLLFWRNEFRRDIDFYFAPLLRYRDFQRRSDARIRVGDCFIRKRVIGLCRFRIQRGPVLVGEKTDSHGVLPWRNSFMSPAGTDDIELTISVCYADRSRPGCSSNRREFDRRSGEGGTLKSGNASCIFDT